MKARILKLTAIFALSITICGIPNIQAQATAGVNQTIAETLSANAGSSNSADTQIEEIQVNETNTAVKAVAGITSALTTYIDSSQETATIQAAEAVATAAVAPVAGYTNLGIAKVNDTLNVRELADENASLVGKMQKDAACEIVSIEGEWAQIQSGEVSGYVKAEYLMTGDEAKNYAQSILSTIATVTADTLYVRQEPTTESDVIAMMPNGEEVHVIENQGEWIKVEVDSEEGYISAQFVTLSEELPKAMTMTEVKYGSGVSDAKVDLVSYATQFVGNRYVWGGTSLTNGADCSGFVLSIYAKYGISLPHSSSAQSGYGTKVSASDAQPGDLFFYGSGRSINHVAIYIGNGQIVHASSAKTGIKISNAFYRSPVCVTRLLQ